MLVAGRAPRAPPLGSFFAPAAGDGAQRDRQDRSVSARDQLGSEFRALLAPDFCVGSAAASYRARAPDLMPDFALRGRRFRRFLVQGSSHFPAPSTVSTHVNSERGRELKRWQYRTCRWWPAFCRTLRASSSAWGAMAMDSVGAAAGGPCPGCSVLPPGQRCSASQRSYRMRTGQGRFQACLAPFSMAVQSLCCA